MSKDAVYEFVSRADSDPEVGYALRGVVGIPAIVRVAAERGFRFTAEELAPVLDLLRFLDNASRDVWLRGELASARDHQAVVALGRGRGYAFSSDELAHLDVSPASQPLADQDLDRVVGGSSGISGINSGMPNRISMSVTIQRQTPQTSFGDKVAAGLSTAGSVTGVGILSAAQAGPIILSPSTDPD